MIEENEHFEYFYFALPNGPDSNDIFVNTIDTDPRIKVIEQYCQCKIKRSKHICHKYFSSQLYFIVEVHFQKGGQPEICLNMLQSFFKSLKDDGCISDRIVPYFIRFNNGYPLDACDVSILEFDDKLIRVLNLISSQIKRRDYATEEQYQLALANVLRAFFEVFEQKSDEEQAEILDNILLKNGSSLYYNSLKKLIKDVLLEDIYLKEFVDSIDVTLQFLAAKCTKYDNVGNVPRLKLFLKNLFGDRINFLSDLHMPSTISSHSTTTSSYLMPTQVGVVLESLPFTQSIRDKIVKDMCLLSTWFERLNANTLVKIVQSCKNGTPNIVTEIKDIANKTLKTNNESQEHYYAKIVNQLMEHTLSVNMQKKELVIFVSHILDLHAGGKIQNGIQAICAKVDNEYNHDDLLNMSEILAMRNLTFSRLATSKISIAPKINSSHVQKMPRNQSTNSLFDSYGSRNDDVGNSLNVDAFLKSIMNCKVDTENNACNEKSTFGDSLHEILKQLKKISEPLSFLDVNQKNKEKNEQFNANQDNNYVSNDIINHYSHIKREAAFTQNNFESSRKIENNLYLLNHKIKFGLHGDDRTGILTVNNNSSPIKQSHLKRRSGKINKFLALCSRNKFKVIYNVLKSHATIVQLKKNSLTNSSEWKHHGVTDINTNSSKATTKTSGKTKALNMPNKANAASKAPKMLNKANAASKALKIPNKANAASKAKNTKQVSRGKRSQGIKTLAKKNIKKKVQSSKKNKDKLAKKSVSPKLNATTEIANIQNQSDQNCLKNKKSLIYKNTDTKSNFKNKEHITDTNAIFISKHGFDLKKRKLQMVKKYDEYNKRLLDQTFTQHSPILQKQKDNSEPISTCLNLNIKSPSELQNWFNIFLMLFVILIVIKCY